MELTKKALLVTTVSGFVPQFEMSNVNILQNMGYEIHYAANYKTPSYGNDNKRLTGTNIIPHQVDFIRNPFSLHNITVFRQLKDLMNKEHFDLVHCHTPMGGVLARLAAHATTTAPVIYTAHGFHFFKGAPLINWLCYYPMEKFLSHFTDEQICINKEDYKRAKKHFHAKYVDYIPGVGIDLEKIRKNINKDKKKTELGISQDKIVLLSSGELIKRKNHETIIRALADLKKKAPALSLPEYQYIICGHGILNDSLKKLAESLQVSDCISFLGYREDMMEIFQIADVFLFPSYQEGLPMALLEAMAYGLPVICSDIRGSRDLIGSCGNQPFNYCSGGIVVKRANDISGFSKAIQLLLSENSARKEMGEWNSKRAKEFSICYVKDCMERIYGKLLP
jgi:glycosyltransferase involved in cell wall biosynthesis